MRRTVVALLALLLLAPAIAADNSRRVVLRATRNTRDLGGLPAAPPGSVVRRHLLYRSGALCFITRADERTVQALHLHTIVDVRVPKEIQRDGRDRVHEAHFVYLPMGNSRGLGAEAYRYLLKENPGAIRAFFHLLAKRDSYPLLFHCSAGKDRTGILTALLLMHLGTSRAVIMDDYMQSVRNSPGLEVHAEWLEVVFHAVDAAGGIEPYLQRVGVPRADGDAVRRILIETRPASAASVKFVPTARSASQH